MNLDNLKTAWQQFRFLNSMQLMEQHEILQLLENGENKTANKSRSLLIHTALFILITLCCQGG